MPLADFTVQVLNPDDPDGCPAFDGYPENAHKALTPGVYPAVVENTGCTVLLQVGETTAVVLGQPS